jgi:hypothetical protein
MYYDTMRTSDLPSPLAGLQVLQRLDEGLESRDLGGMDLARDSARDWLKGLNKDGAATTYARQVPTSLPIAGRGFNRTEIGYTISRVVAWVFIQDL